MPIPALQNYSEFVYSLQRRYGSIQHSTLVLATIGSRLAKLERQIIFEGDVGQDIWELVDFAVGRIRNYSYEHYLAGEKIARYEPFNSPMSPGWPVRILTTTSTSLQISSRTVSQHPESALSNRICSL